jgi:hypothetical protein
LDFSSLDLPDTIAIGLIAHFPVFVASNQGLPSRNQTWQAEKDPFSSINLPFICPFSWWVFQLAMFHDTVAGIMCIIFQLLSQ